MHIALNFRAVLKKIEMKSIETVIFRKRIKKY